MRYSQVRIVITVALTAAWISAIGRPAMAKKRLSSYVSKRDFSVTTEPSGSKKTERGTLPIFVVQKHAASHLHYDFRLEDHGVLVSWAIPKGIPVRVGQKHLAIQTEDHPLEYASFSGVIPPGNYGAGTVELWDNGTFENITKDENGKITPLSACLKKGQLKVKLTGKTLHGTYVFVKTKMGKKSNWLLFKKNPKGPIDSQLSHGDKLLFPKAGITKHGLFEYYRAISPWMLPYTKNRFVTMVRAPEGITGDWFYQKNIPESYPSWIKTAVIHKKTDGNSRMAVINNTKSLLYLANQYCITPHVSLSTIDNITKPDRMIFDLDPSAKNSFAQLCQTALKLKKLLEKMGLKPFVMTTGSRGLHVVIPLIRRANFDTVRAYAHAIANQFAAQNPELTTEPRKEKRHNRIYIDISRNAYGQTSVAPYAVRLRPTAPVATPLFWTELTDKKLTAQRYTIKNVLKKLERDGDPWADFAHSKRALKKIEP